MNLRARIDADNALRRPLTAGGQIVYWRLGATHEARYDVADQPMKGEMDPFFFLTKHKNFIPHEYPCRTAFAASGSGKRPQPIGAFTPAAHWLPFDSPRVDLSGFWFRPTVLGTWAETLVCRLDRRQGVAQAAHLRRRGAVRQRRRGRLDGRLTGAISRRSRNSRSRWLPASTRSESGSTTSPSATRAISSSSTISPARRSSTRCRLRSAGAIAAAMEEALEAMRFERPAYGGGEVALVTDAPVPVGAGREDRRRRRLHVDREAEVVCTEAEGRRDPPADRR